MLIIDTGNTDPWFNLAAEEYFFRKYDREVFMVYINGKSVIIGKHQNPAEEINIKCLVKKDIPLLRRISGGGTVYHDPGNLNYTYIHNSPDGKRVNFKELSYPIISFLNSHGVKAYSGEKNEIRTEGLKISGNAEHVFKNRVLHHGTLLFSADLGLMSECLAPGNALIESRGVKSNRTKVINLERFIKDIDDINCLKSALIEYVLRTNPFAGKYILSQEDIESINVLVKEKFLTWEWNFGYGPDFTFSNEFLIGDTKAKVFMEISRGIITRCIFTGPPGWDKLEKALPGTKHRFEDIKSVLEANKLGADENIVFNFLA